MAKNHIFDTLSADDQRKAQELAEEKGWPLDLGAAAIKGGEASIAVIEASLANRHEKKDLNAIREAEISKLKERYSRAKQDGRVADMVAIKNQLFRQHNVRV